MNLQMPQQVGDSSETGKLISFFLGSTTFFLMINSLVSLSGAREN